MVDVAKLQWLLLLFQFFWIGVDPFFIDVQNVSFPRQILSIQHISNGKRSWKNQFGPIHMIGGLPISTNPFHMLKKGDNFYERLSVSSKSSFFKPVHHLSRLQMKVDKGGDSSCENSLNRKKKTSLSAAKKSIDELYRIAMEEDEEWYNSFVRDILGKDETQEIDTNNNVRHSTMDMNATDKKKRKTVPKDDRDDSGDLLVKVQGKETSETIDDRLDTKINGKSSREYNQRSRKMTTDDREENQETNEQDGESRIDSTKDTMNSTSKPYNEEEQKNDDFIVRFVDMFNNEQKFPMATFSKLGYKPLDVVKLRVEVLELIIEDEIPKPTDNDGVSSVPRRWMVESKDVREVQVLQKRKTRTQIMDDGNNRVKRRRPERSADPFEDRNEIRKKKLRKGPDRERRRQRQSKRESDMDESKASSLWMDMPTFKQYLRREAELRLSILGPDWEEWVRGESDWRLNLYKGWLELLEDGVGEDVFEEISYAPPDMRSRSRINPKRKSVKRKRADGNYDEYEQRPRRRKPDQPRTQRDDDYSISSRNSRARRRLLDDDDMEGENRDGRRKASRGR